MSPVIRESIIKASSDTPPAPPIYRVQAPYPNATFCEELCWGAREDVVPLVKAILEAFPRQGLTLRRGNEAQRRRSSRHLLPT